MLSKELKDYKAGEYFMTDTDALFLVMNISTNEKKLKGQDRHKVTHVQSNKIYFITDNMIIREILKSKAMIIINELKKALETPED